jgi:hypothetical protein
MNFATALSRLSPTCAIFRPSWNGAGQLVKLQVPDARSKMTQPYAYLEKANGMRVPWVPSQGDLFAEDWHSWADATESVAAAELTAASLAEQFKQFKARRPSYPVPKDGVVGWARISSITNECTGVFGLDVNVELKSEYLVPVALRSVDPQTKQLTSPEAAAALRDKPSASNTLGKDGWLARLKDEAAELKDRLDKLTAFLPSDAFDALAFEDRNLLRAQAMLMRELHAILDKRIGRAAVLQAQGRTS